MAPSPSRRAGVLLLTACSILPISIFPIRPTTPRQVGFTDNFGSCAVNGAFPFAAGGDVVIDSVSNPPHLYIADPLNNRVLGFKDYRKVNAGSFADMVIEIGRAHV